VSKVLKTTIDIEDFLRWVYRDQCADVVSGGGVLAGGPRGYGSTFGSIAEIAALGCAVDRSAGGLVNCDLHVDAEAAHDVVMRLEIWSRTLVMHHAKTGGQPDAMADAWPRAVAVLNGGGRPKSMYDSSRNANGCCVEFKPRWSEIVNARSEWVVWRAALDRVAVALRQVGLRDHQITGPKADQRPWNNNVLCSLESQRVHNTKKS